MPEPIFTQLPADANPVPVSSLEDFLVRAKADPVPENIPAATFQVFFIFFCARMACGGLIGLGEGMGLQRRLLRAKTF